MSGLRVVQITKDEANVWVERFHRHSLPVTQHKFSIAAVADGEIVGVAIIERPKARGLQDGWTLEVTRVCTIGHRNACSFLYGAAWRLIRDLGYLRAVTYTKASEEASSVRAAGWVAEGTTKGRKWTTPSRPREDRHEISDRVRWEIRTADWRPGLEPPPMVDVASRVPVGQGALFSDQITA